MPSSTPESYPEQKIQAIDALFEKAGLMRSLRGNAAGVTRRMRFERAAPQELVSAAPHPCVAQNGVEWLAAAGWKRTSWLWHGFSTRRGGLSRAYCADDAPGELNLGFTADDDRETVAANRRLLAEAISGDSGNAADLAPPDSFESWSSIAGADRC